MNTLADKHAVVTGGGSGVGASIALALADAGALVTICGRQAQPLEHTAAGHPHISACTADVTDAASVARLFETVGAVDIVVANAGSTESAPLGRVSDAAWDATIAVNLTGVFLTFREGLKRLEGRGWGRLIAVASTAGLKGYGYVAPYCAAKHGVIGLTRALALETARTGVTVNALCPGFLDTPMTERSIRNISDKTGKSTAEARRVLEGVNPMGRLVDPGEVAAAVLYLCGPGSASVNGQALAIAGGEV